MITDFFDTLFPSAIEGNIEAPVVRDKDSTPNRVLELGDDWEVDVSWSLKTSNASTYPLSQINGTWHLELSVESIGEGFEGPVANDTLNYASTHAATPTEYEWKHTFKVPASKVPDEAIYELGTLITFKDSNGIPMAMAAFFKGPAVTFYQAP
jgi:hypothetical protein